MRFKNGGHCSHYGGHFGSYFQYGRQKHKIFSKCSNSPITKKIDIYRLLEECDLDQCDFKMAGILAAIFKMAAKMHKISKCSNFIFQIDM
jgi:hypothetical protein